MADSVWGTLKKKIRSEMNEIADHMATGSCKSFEEYRQMVGMIEGLAWVEREILDLEEKLNQS
jgi:hypothetical protein